MYGLPPTLRLSSEPFVLFVPACPSDADRPFVVE